MNTSHSGNAESSAETSLEPLLNERQYAALTGESVATARRNRILGRGCPWVKLGSLVRYRPRDIRSYIAHNLHETSKENR